MFVFIFTMIGIVALYAISWIITCGIIKLITMLLGLSFSWTIATAIWLIMLLLRSVFSGNK